MWRRTTPSEARQEPERVTRGRKAGVRLRGARWARGDGTRRCRYRQYSIEIKYVFIRTHIYKLQFSTRPRKEPMGRDTIESERHRELRGARDARDAEKQRTHGTYTTSDSSHVSRNQADCVRFRRVASHSDSVLARLPSSVLVFLPPCHCATACTATETTK